MNKNEQNVYSHCKDFCIVTLVKLPIEFAPEEYSIARINEIIFFIKSFKVEPTGKYDDDKSRVASRLFE